MTWQISLSRQADADIDAILGFASNRWNEATARRYSKRFDAAFERLRAYPDLGKDDNNLVGIRILMVGEHRPYYRQVESTIRVLRVIHQRAADPIIDE